MSNSILKVLIVGVGNMGMSHAKAYERMDHCKIVGLVSRNIENYPRVKEHFESVPTYSDFYQAVQNTQPNIVVISTYPDTHSEFAIYALRNNAHVFLEKPLATKIEDARKVVETARQFNRKLVVGYILQHHPSWTAFLETGNTLGRPLVIRLNLNQQSTGTTWQTHKNILATGLTPIVDCGVHYLDFMCRLLKQRPIRVHAIGAKLSEESPINNYGQLQVTFEDGSVGWYEAGWGPMMSQTADFIKDIIGPKGSVSMVPDPDNQNQSDSTRSDTVASHVRTECLKIHSSERLDNGAFKHADTFISTEEEPDHDELCFREQSFLVESIRENLDLNTMWESAIDSLEIALAADQSAREGKVIHLSRKVETSQETKA